MEILITGGSGFFGELLKKSFLENGHDIVSIDLENDLVQHENLVSYKGDIRNREYLESIFQEYIFDAVFHCAAILAHAVKDKQFLWESNVDGTKNIVELAVKYNVKKIVFTSSNCLWAQNLHRPVLENDIPNPVEIYGKSKYEGEKILLSHASKINVIIFRCPTIIDAGRLGLLGILFEFIRENRKVWVVGGGNNVYQFIYANDLIRAFFKALDYDKINIFNIGSDNVKSFKEVYQYVIEKCGSKSKVIALPRRLTILGMQIAHFLKGVFPFSRFKKSLSFSAKNMIASADLRRL